MRKSFVLASLIAATVIFTLVAAAQEQSAVNSASTATSTAATPAKTTVKPGASATSKTAAIHVEPSQRIEGEKRFHANCGRCHMAPQKLPPRAAATIIRHMRVRATITDEDMRLILAYLTQ